MVNRRGHSLGSENKAIYSTCLYVPGFCIVENSGTTCDRSGPKSGFFLLPIWEGRTMPIGHKIRSVQKRTLPVLATGQNDRRSALISALIQPRLLDTVSVAKPVKIQKSKFKALRLKAMLFDASIAIQWSFVERANWRKV